MFERLEIGETLRAAPGELPVKLQEAARQLNFSQKVEDDAVYWYDDGGQVQALFIAVPDPRNLEAILAAYSATQETGCPRAFIYVHQWTDGVGNWDVFTITPDRRMAHGGRFGGGREVEEQGPALREDIYELFSCGQPFPAPGCQGWSKLLAGPREDVVEALGKLAEERGCVQTLDEDIVSWHNVPGELEAMFFLLPEPADIDAFVSIYAVIRQRRCPVTFVFLKQMEPGTFDIFRLSARSYLEHHNQAKRSPCE